MLCYTTIAVDWVVRRSNHRTVLSSATTGLDLPIPASRHGSPLRFQGLSLPAPHHARFQGPSVQFIDLEVVGLLSMSCHRTLQFIVMLDDSSLTSWGTYRTAQAMLGWDVLVTAVVLAYESCKLIHDISYHEQTSAGRAHCYAMLS
jgi:hypothetical protein